MDVNLEELARFLFKAKRNTYAGGGEGMKGLDKSKNFQFKEGEYVYKDRYFGSDRFGGEEVVWLKEEPIWLMNYYGGIIKKIIDSTTVFAFLRKALSQVSYDRPFRGPNSCKEGDFEYKISCSGDITWFRGTEEILYRGETVYRLGYFGGVTKEKW